MMKQVFTASFAGLLFGAGLTISTMVYPARVLSFLDIFGNWDPTLAFVMAGGLFVYLPIFYFYIKPQSTTLFGESFQLPNKQGIDTRLVIGAVIFGIGWGLSGICPGPAVTNLSGGLTETLMFIFSMLLGMIGASKLT
jgi:uncharacterized membrane protein YedE/YeeE